MVTQNEGHAVAVQIRNVTTTGFQIRLREQEANAQAHVAETVHFLAWEPGAGTINGFAFEVGSRSANHNFTSFPFTSSFTNPPVFFAGTQTVAGAEAYSLRYQGLGTGSVQVRLQEDDSADAEFSHVLETVGYLSLAALPLEAGRVSGVTGGWTPVTFSQAFTTPIVTAGPFSYADAQPAVLRERRDV